MDTSAIGTPACTAHEALVCLRERLHTPGHPGSWIGRDAAVAPGQRGGEPDVARGVDRHRPRSPRRSLPASVWLTWQDVYVSRPHLRHVNREVEGGA